METLDKEKFPRGIDSWLETHFQIVEFMGYNQTKTQKVNMGSVELDVTIKGLPMIEELDGQGGKQEFAEALTTKFETLNKETDFTETHFYDVLDEFLNKEFEVEK